MRPSAGNRIRPEILQSIAWNASLPSRVCWHQQITDERAFSEARCATIVWAPVTVSPVEASSLTLSSGTRAGAPP